MKVYEYVLPFFMYGFAVLFVMMFLYMAAIGLSMAYDLIKETGGLSHILAAGMLVAGIIIAKFRKQKTGRHFRELDNSRDVSLWDDILDEFEARPYSLCRSNSIIA